MTSSLANSFKQDLYFRFFQSCDGLKDDVQSLKLIFYKILNVLI